MKYAIFDKIDRCTSEEVQRLLPLVSEQQRNKALRFQQTAKQFASLKGFLMLKEVLAESYIMEESADLSFEYNPHGKPYLKHYPHIHFNISHCHHSIAVAVDSTPVGVDVERFVKPSEALLNYCMCEHEVHKILQSEYPERQFAAYWTQKEALFKLLGTGITHELRDILAKPHPNIQLTTQLFIEQSFALTIATTVPQE